MFRDNRTDKTYHRSGFTMTLIARTSIAAAAALFSGLAAAASIGGLVNTGAGQTTGSTDTNYKYTATGDAAGLAGFGVVSNGATDPFPYWLPNTASSSWLIPGSDQGTNYSPTGNSTFTWTLNFDLTGYDASSASFSGHWAADNNGVLLLNGVAISSIAGERGFAEWTSFSASSGFVAGVNTLQFVVTDTANSTYNFTGVRAEFLSSNVNAAIAPAVPEPHSYALMLAGLGALGFLARRRS